MHPRTHGAPDSERDKKRKKTNTTFSHIEAARVVRSSPKLCTVIELVVPIKKGVFLFFDPTYSFSYRVH